MIISIIYLILSLLLDGLMSNIFPSTLTSINIFTTIYILISLVVIYPFFANDKKYYILVIIFGLLFDIMYTSTFIFGIILFLILGIVIKLLYNIFPENIFTTNIISIVIITLYHFLSYIILSIFSGISYDFIILLKIVASSLIMTFIYTTISYYLVKLIYSKLKIREIK